MRRVTLALAAAAVIGGIGASAPGAVAQVVDFGQGGIGLDLRSSRQRQRDVEREDARREFERDDYERRREARRRARYEEEYGSRCREVTVRERNAYGEIETRRSRDCY